MLFGYMRFDLFLI